MFPAQELALDKILREEVHGVTRRDAFLREKVHFRARKCWLYH